jgi:hypothetical protein
MWVLLILLILILVFAIKGRWFGKSFEIVIDNTPPPNEATTPITPPSDSIPTEPIDSSKGTSDPQITVQWR